MSPLRRIRVPVPSKRVVWVAWLLVTLLAAALFVWLILTVFHQSDQIDHAEAKTDAVAATAKVNGQTARQAKDAAVALGRQVKRLGGTPVVNPNSIPGPTKVTGPEGPAGPSPTRSQVFAAVSIFCSSGACEHGPSASQVETAVASYCAPRNDCQGAQGGTGAPGSNGNDGAPGGNGNPGVDGQPGQNASDAQVQAAVNTYCDAHNGCQGPTGAAGPQGDRGPQGIPGTAVPGAYTCPDATPFLHGFTVADDGSVSLDCIALLHN